MSKRPEDPPLGKTAILGSGQRRVAVELHARPDAGVVYRKITFGPARKPTGVTVEIARTIPQAPRVRRTFR